MLDRRLHRIAQGIEILARRDRKLVVFGSEKHRHRLGPLLAESEAQAFERGEGVSLPEAYRAFLTRLGNGGAGPSYGLIPLAPLRRARLPAVMSRIAVRGDAPGVTSGSGPRPVPSRPSETARPFPLDAGWCVADPPAWPEDTSPYDGCLELADLGCGTFDLLVVAGPRSGEVWSDTTVIRDTGSLRPTGRDFLTWYEAWLEGALETWAADQVRAAVCAGALPLDGELAELAARAELPGRTGWESWERIGYLCLADGRHQEAQLAFERARDESPARGARYWITQCHRHLVLADPAARLRAAEQGLALRPFAKDRRALEHEKAEALRALDGSQPVR